MSNLAIKYIKFNKSEIKKQYDLFQYMFDSKKEFGYIRFRNNSLYKNYNLCSLDNETYIQNIVNTFGKEDLYYSTSIYKTEDTARKEDISAIKLLTIDLDFTSSNNSKFKNLTIEQVVKILEYEEFNINIPLPNVIEYSRNLRLIYVLDDAVGGTPKSISLSNRILQVLSERLSHFGSDKQTVTNFCRFVSSINTKDNSTVQAYIYSNYKYSLGELQEEWLEPLPKWYPTYILNKEKRKNRKVINFVDGEYKHIDRVISLNLGRIKDLERIQEYFDYNMTGDREFMTFLYRNHCLMIMDKEKAREKTMEFYKRFKNYQENKHIESQTRNVEKRQYKFKSETILERLGITPEIEIELGLSVTLSEVEKKRRDKINKKLYEEKNKEVRNEKKKENRKKNKIITAKQKELIELKNNILMLKEKGLNNSEIAKKLNINRTKVIRLLK